MRLVTEAKLSVRKREMDRNPQEPVDGKRCKTKFKAHAVPENSEMILFEKCTNRSETMTGAPRWRSC